MFEIQIEQRSLLGVRHGSPGHRQIALRAIERFSG
jgi:hypothetical protein